MATTLKQSGYLASAVAVTFAGTQQLTSLADNEWVDLSNEVDNTTNLYAYADLELVLGSAAFTGTDCGLEIYIVPTIDGTNYPDWTGNSTADAPGQGHYFARFLPISASTSAKRVVSNPEDPVGLPAGKFKFGARSRANVALAASGNTLSYRPRSFDSV